MLSNEAVAVLHIHNLHLMCCAIWGWVFVALQPTNKLFFRGGRVASFYQQNFPTTKKEKGGEI
jgi:hypothetical protein